MIRKPDFDAIQRHMVSYLLLAIGAGLTSSRSPALGDVIRWEYTGRLINILAPDDAANGLRLGDPVSGLVQLDTDFRQLVDHQGLPVEASTELVRFQALSFEAANPRNGNSIGSPSALEDVPQWLVIEPDDTPDSLFILQGFETVDEMGEPFFPVLIYEGADPQKVDGGADSFNVDETVIDFEVDEDTWLTAAIFQMSRVHLPTGDVNTDLVVDHADIDTLAIAISVRSQNEFYDLNNDGVVDSGDHEYWVNEIANTNSGDANLDGIVDFADFLVLSSNFGSTGGWAEGNFDLGPSVAFSDFLLMSANFGETTEVANVPEPVSLTYVSSLVALLVATSLRESGRQNHNGAYSPP